MSLDIALLSLAQLSQLIRQRKISPVELVENYVDRIERLDPLLHSFNHVLLAESIESARVAERELMGGTCYGPLHGIPIGLKDLIDVAGAPTTAQSAHLRDNIATADAEVVKALRRGGAIILGKQATAEYAVGGTQFDLPWPPPRNPWNLELDTASSSSGSAVGVAAGLCAGAVGSDTSGSIRVPAAWCGVAGLMPTEGLVSRRGILPLSRTIDCIGPLAWTAADCALMLGAMYSDDPEDRRLPGWHVPRLSGVTEPASGLRIGVLRHYYEDDPDLDGDIRQAMANTLAALQAAGTSIQDVRLADFETYAAAARKISWPEEYAEHGPELEAFPERFGKVTRSRLQDGRGVPAYDYIRAQCKRRALTAEIEAVLRDVDVIVLPTVSKPAQVLGYEHTELAKTTRWLTRPFNLTGSPALSVCNGFSVSGLPLGLQIVGRRYDDGTVLQVGHSVETELGMRDRRPQIAALGQAVIARCENVARGSNSN
ncbi:amidase [Mesorhizobium sp. IMUNJ 23232]|uniref:amidase n=1 Tax=Mesorhizobium sp. IMUNJ 23232 TaxID=3376064 RepID=UPI00379B5267